MGDENLSASELRRRYHKGGTAKDSELSASQIRSRHNIENTKFSGGPVGAGGGNLLRQCELARCLFRALDPLLHALGGHHPTHCTVAMLVADGCDATATKECNLC